MSKWMIGVLVVLLGLMVALQWVNKKNESRLATSELQPPAPITAAATKEVSAIPKDFSSVATTRQPLGPVPGPDGAKSACQGGSLNELLAAHGVAWGYIPNVLFSQGDTVKLTNALEEYFACQVVSAETPGACSYLSANEPFTASLSAVKSCQKRADYVLFPAFTLNKFSDMSTCARRINWTFHPDFSDQPEKYCPVLAQGMEKFCTGGGEYQKKCKEGFPTELSDCGKIQKDSNIPFNCVNRQKIYAALKANSPDLCPALYRPLCAAFLSKSAAKCSSLAMKASNLYCSGLANVSKLEENKKAEERRLLEEQQLQAQKTMQLETDKKVKEARAEQKAEEKALQDSNAKLRKLMGQE
ncbi:MAG TPA: hypothetical protein PKI19_10020 [Elusimicrobiales bacterium]|nr:hypothetical protein [Elusimicrobiales bacterium]